MFQVRFQGILNIIDKIDPVLYATTRNFTNGSVSMLSPYISRGVISPLFVYNRLRAKYTAKECTKFLSELLWREYFQRLLQHNPDIAHEPQYPETNTVASIPEALITASTGIEAIDEGIKLMYDTGYMHNHLRMYVASTAHLAGYRYYAPASWMYYHLLDGDIASNYCSWQWVSGLHTGKVYSANQDNINFFCGTKQKGTFLDHDLDDPAKPHPIAALQNATRQTFSTILPDNRGLSLRPVPTLIYNSYNLDPIWHEEMPANRILFFDTDHFSKYPVSEKVIRFIQKISNNIKDIQTFTGSYQQLTEQLPDTPIFAKEHPLFVYPGAIIEEREWLAPHVHGYFKSFSSYYKNVLNTHHDQFL